MPPLDPQLDTHFDEAARLNNLDPMLLRALAMGESSGNAGATSPQGAGGLMQIMPDTAKKHGIADPYDPVQAIYGGAKILGEGLTNAEKLKQSGRADINPVDYALRTYFGGEEGPQWGQKTAAYPGYIASKYQALTQPQSVNVQPLNSAAAPANGIAQLAAAGSGGNGPSAPQIAAMNGTAAPENAAFLQRALGNGNPQVAQTALTIPSDQELLRGLQEVGPLMRSPAAPGGNAAMPSPGGQPMATGAPAATSVLGPEQVIQMLNTAAQAKGGLAAVPGLMSTVEKMLSEGTQFVQRPDGSIGIAPIAGATDAKRDIASAGKQGTELLQPGPGGLQNQPGVVESGAEKAGAEQRAKTRNNIFETRPGTVPRTGAEIQDAAEAAAAGSGVPGQSSMYNNPGIAEGENLAAKHHDELRKTYAANQSSAQNLKNFVDAAAVVGTGRGTTLSGTTAAWLKSINVDPQKLSLADPAEVEKMQKAANQMIVSTVKGISSKPAYADFNFVSQGLVDPEKQGEADRSIAAALAGRMDWENKLYKDWDADRRSPAAAGSYSHFDFPAWAEANPQPGFQAAAYQKMPVIPQRGVLGSQAPAITDGQTATHPQTGEKRVYRGGQWVPMQ